MFVVVAAADLYLGSPRYEVCRLQLYIIIIKDKCFITIFICEHTFLGLSCSRHNSRCSTFALVIQINRLQVRTITTNCFAVTRIRQQRVVNRSVQALSARFVGIVFLLNGLVVTCVGNFHENFFHCGNGNTVLIDHGIHTKRIQLLKQLDELSGGGKG